MTAIPDEAVEAAHNARLSFKSKRGVDNSAALMRHILEAAAPYLMADVEWAVFRASDGPDGTPVENFRYRSREAAQAAISAGYTQAEYWEPRGREVGEWAT